MDVSVLAKSPKRSGDGRSWRSRAASTGPRPTIAATKNAAVEGRVVCSKTYSISCRNGLDPATAGHCAASTRSTSSAHVPTCVFRQTRPGGSVVTECHRRQCVTPGRLYTAVKVACMTANGAAAPSATASPRQTTSVRPARMTSPVITNRCPAAGARRLIV
jgi:hypothetical protein